MLAVQMPSSGREARACTEVTIGHILHRIILEGPALPALNVTSTATRPLSARHWRQCRVEDAEVRCGEAGEGRREAEGVRRQADAPLREQEETEGQAAVGSTDPEMADSEK